MLFRRTILTIFSFLVAFAYAAPLDVEGLQKRAQHEIIGYRYVREEVARAYNRAGTLVSVPANGVQIGDGAYLSPGPGQWAPPHGYWLCVVTADRSMVHALPKLWIPPHDNRGRPLFWKKNESNLHSYIRKAHMDPARTLLFSYIEGSHPPLIQMLIPQGYLSGSHGWLPNTSAHRGPDIQVRCYPPGTHVPEIQAGWGSWQIPGFGH